jgi:hypothetical protein
MCVRSTNCETFTEQDICNACLMLKNDNRFRNGVARPVPKPENRKFVPKHYFKTNALANHLQYTDLQQLHKLLTDSSEQSGSDLAFWRTFASKASQGVFDKKPVFKGLCQVMLQVAKASEANRGKQGLHYSTEFTNFLVILGSISPKSLDLFRQNLEGQSLRNIRYEFFIV